MSNKKSNNDNSLKLERAWRYYQHADNLFAGRINFFLVAESMLVVSFVTSQGINFVNYLIISLGIVYTSGWYVVNFGLLRRMAMLNKEYLENLDPLYKRYVGIFPGWPSRFVHGYLLPLTTLIFWLLLLCAMIFGNNICIMSRI